MEGGAVVLAIVLVLALVAGSTRPVVGWLARPLVEVDAVDRVDAIVVLGQGSDADGTLSAGTAYALVHGIRLYRRGISGVLVLTGGSHRGSAATDADAMAEAARAFGVPADALVLERSPSTTVEHARAVAALAARRGLRTVAVVTPPLRSRRATLALRRAGVAAVAAPGVTTGRLVAALLLGRDDPLGRLGVTAEALSEHLALVVYRIRGWT